MFASYRKAYNDQEITKEDIFFYVYGLLHSTPYRNQYKADLSKMLPRIPKVKDFWGYNSSGRKLAHIHTNYETVNPYPLKESARGQTTDLFDYYRVQKISFGSRTDKTRIVYNNNVTLEGIPEEALAYQVNGKSALQWVIERYQVTTNKDSQIRNDPNDYSREVGDPRYILDLIKRIVTVSVETVRIVRDLPPLEIME